MSRRPFSAKLKALGFRKDGEVFSRDCLIYKRDELPEIDREIEVQLWSDGEHRASHWIAHDVRGVDGEVHHFRHMITTPTGFADVEEMLVAIEHERARTDHPERRA